MKAIILLIVLVPFYIVAQDTTFLNMSLEELLNVKVYSSSKKQESIINTPSAVNVLTAEDIRMLNFNTLEQVLEYVTGMASINGEGNVFTTTTIKGNTQVNYNTNTLLLFDGIPLFNAYHGSFDFQAIPLSSIERVEIIKGSASVLYGSNAMNGVINIISKKGEDDKSYTSAKIKYGSFNSLYSNATIVRNKDDLHLGIFIDAVSTDGEELLLNDEDGKELMLTNFYKGISVASKVNYRNFKFEMLYYTKSMPGVRTRNFPVTYTSLDDTVGILKPELSNSNSLVTNISYDYDINEKIKFAVRSNSMNWSLHKSLYDGFWDYSSFGLYNDATVTVTSSSRFSNKVGISYNHYLGRRYKSQMDDYDIGKNKVWTNDVSLYLNGEYELTRKLKVFYGGRYYYAKYGSNSFDNVSPRFALTYSPINNFYIKAVYGSSFRIPTYFEKEVESDKIIGNPDLLPEKSTSHDLIFSGIIKGVQFDADLFFTEFQDKITRVTSPVDSNMKINMNVGNLQIGGAELNVKFRIKKYAYGFIGYSYSEYVGEPDIDVLPIYNNMLTFGGKVKLGSVVELNTSAKVMDDWGKAPAYVLMNMGTFIKVSKKIPFYLEFKIDNILDTDVYLPEIARRSDMVPTIPKTHNRMFFVGISFH